MINDENEMNTGPGDTDSADAVSGDAEAGNPDQSDAAADAGPSATGPEGVDPAGADHSDTAGDEEGEVEAGAGDVTPESTMDDADAEDSEGSEFVRWDESSLTQVPISKLAHRTVVKKRFVKNERPVKISPVIPRTRLHSQADAEITPILQDDQIVGVQVACNCGSVHEIMFDFLPS